jgi:hypothetical protein
MARIAKSAADLPRNSQISLVEAISMASSRATVEQFTELTYATGARVVEDHRRRRPRGCRHDGRHRRAQAPRAPPLRLRRVASTAARAVGRSLQQRAQLARTSPRFTRFSGSSARMTERVAAISAAALARSPLAGPLLGAPAPRVLGPTTLPSFLIDPASVWRLLRVRRCALHRNRPIAHLSGRGLLTIAFAPPRFVLHEWVLHLSAVAWVSIARGAQGSG